MDEYHSHTELFNVFFYIFVLKDTIFKMLWNACKLTGPFERRCRVYVFRYGKKLIELAKEKLTPKLCQTFGLCDKVQLFQGMSLITYQTWGQLF